MATSGEPGLADREGRFLRLVLLLSLVVLIAPLVLGLVLANSGQTFLGFPYNTDDHMVYAAWMRQAMDGRFFFDNRFTTDPQAGLTINLYFFATGLLAKLLGIMFAAHLARVGFGLLFIVLLFRLVKWLGSDPYATKMAMILGLLGGGLGFLVWHDFGVDLVRPSTLWMSPLTGGKLPTDIWQPEGYAFSSLLTNGLFAVSLCLIVAIFSCVIAARNGSWKAVAIGAVCSLVLMNIHSYDMLLVALVLTGLLVASSARKQVTFSWLLKALLIGLGAAPAALWVWHTLQVDPVFRARAATLTYSANFRAVLVGYLPLIALGLVAIYRRDGVAAKRRKLGVLVIGLVLAALAAYSTVPYDGYFLSPVVWLAVLVGMLGAIYLLSDDSPTYNLLLSWALVGLIAIYFPGLFQRKLGMGLAIPWSILAGLGLADLLRLLPRSTRNYVTALSLVVLCATAVRWPFREWQLMRSDVSETTVQPVYLSRDLVRILGYLNDLPRGRVVVQAMPGIPSHKVGDDGADIPDQYDRPIIPDYNPIVSGLTGVYTVAGHWSETPDYAARRLESIERLFSSKADDATRLAYLSDTKTDYVLTPTPGSINGLTIPNLESLGSVVIAGDAFELIDVRRKPVP